MSPTMGLATAWEAVADEIPDRPALVHGAVERTWREFDERAARVAGHLDAAGLGPDAKVAFYLYNGNEYLEATFGSFKARCVPVNVNYRYLEQELHYLLENSDAEAVVVSAELVGRLDHVRGDLPLIRTVLCVGGSGEHPVPDWAVDYEDALAAAAPLARIDRSPEDLWFLYTGGTTGMPKGVMWPHRSLMGAAAPTFRAIKADVPTTPEGFAAAARTFHDMGRAVRLLPAAPLMHGTSAIASIGVLCAGGCIITLTDHSLDADELCATVQDREVNQLTIVGDAFAKPILTALERAAAAGRPYDLSSLRMVVSSGVIWSQPVKDALLEWCDAVLADLLGSSEGVGFGNSVARRGRSASTASFRLGEHARVFTDDGREVAPGLRGGRHAGRGRAHPHRLLQGPRQDRGHVPDLRGAGVVRPRRLRHRGGGRHHPPAGARLGVHQHGGGEGLPGGGGGGAQAPPRGPGRQRGGPARRAGGASRSPAWWP